MGNIFSLQGSMAVGKTTALKMITQNEPAIHVSFEDNSQVIATIKHRGLDKNQAADFFAIQKLWIQNEVERYRRVEKYPCTLMDFGAEEIEFYTLNYPKSIGQDWPVEQALEKELQVLRRCLPQRILSLTASSETLWARKQADQTRSREFFAYQLEHLLPLKKAWFQAKSNVDWLQVDDLTQEEVAQAVLQWVQRQINE